MESLAMTCRNCGKNERDGAKVWIEVRWHYLNGKDVEYFCSPKCAIFRIIDRGELTGHTVMDDIADRLGYIVKSSEAKRRG